MKLYISPTSPPTPELLSELRRRNLDLTISASDTAMTCTVSLRGTSFKLSHTLGDVHLTRDQLTNPMLELVSSLTHGTFISAPPAASRAVENAPPPTPLFPKREKLTPSYVQGHGDIIWRWNMGWRAYKGSGTPDSPILAEVSTKPLGHLEFSRLRASFPRMTPPSLSNSLTHLGRRSYSDDWRRWVTEDIARFRTLYTHPEFGEGFISASDGLHAIFTTNESLPRRVEVMFANLTEVRSVSVHKTPTAKVPKDKSINAKVASLTPDQQDKLAALLAELGL